MQISLVIDAYLLSPCILYNNNNDNNNAALDFHH